MKQINMPCYNIKVTIDNDGAGIITSDLEDGDCICGIESIILAHACAGIDITDPAYIKGIETVVEAE